MTRLYCTRLLLAPDLVIPTRIFDEPTLLDLRDVADERLLARFDDLVKEDVVCLAVLGG